MTEEERKWMEYWQRQQAEENARAIWSSLSESNTAWAISFLVLFAGGAVLMSIMMNWGSIISWIGNHLLMEGAAAVLVLGVVATRYFFNRLDRDIKQQAEELRFVERCNQTPNDLPPGWGESLNAGGYVQDRSGQWVKHV